MSSTDGGSGSSSNSSGTDILNAYLIPIQTGLIAGLIWLTNAIFTIELQKPAAIVVAASNALILGASISVYLLVIRPNGSDAVTGVFALISAAVVGLVGQGVVVNKLSTRSNSDQIARNNEVDEEVNRELNVPVGAAAPPP